MTIPLVTMHQLMSRPPTMSDTRIHALTTQLLPQKVEAIKKLDYPSTLSELETGLGLFGYYRKYSAL